jgi:flagellar FliL protein
MSIQVAVMTRYDQRVVDNIKKHEFALRSAMMDVMRQSQESDVNKPEFRVELAKKLRDAMNSLLEKYEEFGGVEDVFFTSFIIQ